MQNHTVGREPMGAVQGDPAGGEPRILQTHEPGSPVWVPEALRGRSWAPFLQSPPQGQARDPSLSPNLHLSQEQPLLWQP